LSGISKKVCMNGKLAQMSFLNWLMAFSECWWKSGRSSQVW
jgi:hypothetical protein